MKSWREEFRRQFPKAKPDEPMSRHTTFRIGGPADVYLEIKSFADLAPVYSFARQNKIPVTILGWGSNILVLDGGIRGIVLRLRGDFEKIEFLEDHVVRAGAGVRLPTLVTACAERGLAGAEPLVGVPGTIGGALVMNAGTCEGEIGELVRAVRWFNIENLKDEWIPAKDIQFGYRRSSLENRVLLGVELVLKPGSKVDILKRVRALQDRRQKTQPIHTYNVGSTFKNPPGLFIAKMIEEAGLKGLRCGGAKVSEKHANFFENEGNATAKDVLDLAERVRDAIRRRSAVELELEMKVVGEA